MKLLFDADMIVYHACVLVEQEINWGDDFWTLHSDAEEAKRIVDMRVQAIATKVLDHYQYKGAYEIFMCFSDATNFRYKVLATYKSNRKGRRKPVAYQAVKHWVMENYNSYLRTGLEADDCMGILATLNPNNSIIISGDKDMKQIPCRFFDFSRDVFTENDEKQADYWFYYQCLTGDITDGYNGCPGIGDKTAIKLLDSEGASWQTVLKAYQKKGITEEEALKQARVARILRKTDYNFKTKQPILWRAGDKNKKQ